MRKLISMMLMLCAVITFSACSSDDDEPKNPISNAVVPASAKIGSEVTVQGNGFTSTQKFYLTYSDKTAYPVELTDAKVSSSGVTFTVPYTAKEDQTVSFVVTDNDTSWNVGTMKLLAADNPLSAVSIPSQTPLSTNVTITGIGFADGDKIGIAEENDSEGIVYLDTKVVDGGVEISTLVSLEGNMDVYLCRGNSVWKIGKTYTYLQRVIGSITISDNFMLSMYAGRIGLEGSALKLEMNYDSNYALQSVTSNSDLEYTMTYSGNTVSFTSPLTGMPYTYTLDANKRIVSSTSYDIYGDEVTYTWNYNADGYLVSITSSAKETILESTYADGNLQAYTFGIDCGSDNANTLAAYPGTVEPIYLLNTFSWLCQKDDLFFGFLLNQNVKISRSVLSQFNAVDTEYESIDEKTKTYDVKSSIDGSSALETTLTLSTSSEDGVMSVDGGLYSNKVVVAYSVK